MTKKPALVEVLWRDVWTKLGDHTLDEARAVPLCSRATIGYIVEQTADILRVSHTYDAPEKDVSDVPTYCDVTVIPLALVQRVRYVERGPRKVPTSE